MSGVKDTLSFVGKSVAFAVISGVVWCIMFAVVYSFSSKNQAGAASSTSDSGYEERVDAYNKQTQTVQTQLEQNEQMQSRSVKLLEAQERSMAEQERLQKRFSAVLDKWEKTSIK